MKFYLLWLCHYAGLAFGGTGEGAALKVEVGGAAGGGGAAVYDEAGGVVMGGAANRGCDAVHLAAELVDGVGGGHGDAVDLVVEGGGGDEAVGEHAGDDARGAEGAGL